MGWPPARYKSPSRLMIYKYRLIDSVVYAVCPMRLKSFATRAEYYWLHTPHEYHGINRNDKGYVRCAFVFKKTHEDLAMNDCFTNFTVLAKRKIRYQLDSASWPW